MLAIGGTIGPGYFIGMGTGLSTSGPAGLLIGFAIVSMLLWTVTQSLGEMGAFISVSGKCWYLLLRKLFYVYLTQVSQAPSPIMQLDLSIRQWVLHWVGITSFFGLESS